MKTYRGTFFLLAVLAALGAFVYFYEVRGPASEQSKEKEAAIFTLEEDDIVTLHWRNGERTIALAKDEVGHWQVTAPEAAEADEWTMMTLLWRLAILTADQVVAEEIEDPAAYGLSNPPMELQLGLADGGQETLYLGEENPRGTGFYAQKAGSAALYLVNISVVTDLRKLDSEPPNATPTIAPSAQPTPTP